MMDPVLLIIIASCMTLTQFAGQLRDGVASSAYSRNCELVLDSIQAVHALLEELKKFKAWGTATDAAKKAFQNLEDALRKATGLLQKCMSARSRLLQLVSEQALTVDDFKKVHSDLEAVFAKVPTDTLTEPLQEQLCKLREQLLNTPFIDTLTPEMRDLFTRLLQEDMGGRKTSGQFPAGSLADQLAIDNPQAFRKEQEALALEKRKAHEGRDRKQQEFLEQIAAVLARMEKEVGSFKDLKKQSKMRTHSDAASMAKSPRDLVSPTKQASMKLNMALGPDDVSGNTADVTASPGGSRNRSRRSERPHAPPPLAGDGRGPPSFTTWVADDGGGQVVGTDRSSTRQAPGESRMGPQMRTKSPVFSQSPREGRMRQQVSGEFMASSPRAHVPHPPSHQPFSPVSRPKSRDGSSRRGEEEEEQVGWRGGREERERSSRREEPGSRSGRKSSTQVQLDTDMNPDTDVSRLDPEAPHRVVQSLLYGTAEEKSFAATNVAWFTMRSVQNRLSFCRAGAVEALLALANSRETKTSEAALSALLNLSQEDEGKAELLSHLPGVVQILKRADTPAMRAGSAKVVKNLAFSGDSQAKIIDAGGIPALVRFLSADDTSKQSTLEALAALTLCETRRIKFITEGAVMPIALVLRSNPSSETLMAACAALARLATIPEGRDAMGLVVPSLVNVLRLDLPEALQDAVEALLLLARHSPTYRSSIRNNGGMRYLRNVLRSGPATLHPKAMELLAALFS